MKQKKIKSSLAFLLVLCMVFCMQTNIVYAQENDVPADTVNVTDVTETTNVADTTTEDIKDIDSVDTTETEKESQNLNRGNTSSSIDDNPEITVQTNAPMSGSCGVTEKDNVTWNLEQNNEDNENPTYRLTISGKGAMANYATGDASPWNYIKTSITKVVIAEGVTSIGNRAFFGCYNMESIELPNTLSRIGQNSFHTCTSLTTLNISAAVDDIAVTGFSGEMIVSAENAYYAGVGKWIYKLNNTDNTAALWYVAKISRNSPSITIPEIITWQDKQFTVTAIGDISVDNDIFGNDANLKSVSLPDTVIEIGTSSFRGCSSLGLIDISNVNKIGANAFYECSSLNKIELNNKILEIPDNLFKGCIQLTNISLPDSLTSIGRYAFSSTGILEIDIPENVTIIGDYAFVNCLSLKSVTGGESLQRLKSQSQNQGYVFGGCTKLESVDLIGTSALEIPTNTFGNTSNQNPIKIFKLKNGSFASGFTFAIKDTLEEVYLGNVNIPDVLFKDQTSLSKVELNGVDSIGRYAFSNCSALERVKIFHKNSVIISDFAFNECQKLKSVIINATQVTFGGAVINADKAIEILDLSSVENITLSSTTPIAINRSGANPNVVCYVNSADKQSVISNQFTTNTVYFAVTNGGSFSDDTKFTANTIATPTKANYNFLSWYDNANFTGTTVSTIELGKTYYAKWKAKNVSTISFKGNLTLDKTYDGNAVSLSADDYTVTGDNRKVTFSYQVKDGNDWKDIDSAPTNARTYQVKAIVAENDTDASAETDWKEFTISKANQTYTKPTGLTAVVGQTLSDVALPEGFAWQDATTTSVGVEGTHTFKITYTPADTDNYNIVNDIDIKLTVNPKMEVLNAIPIINASDKILTIGDIFNPLDGVSASDKEEGDLTDKITVESNNVDTATAGTYTVIYKVADSQEANCIKTIHVTVNPKMEVLNAIPIINASDKILTIGDIFNPLDGVSASDKEEGDLTNKITVESNNVDTATAGIYTVIYKVADSQGANCIKTIHVTVNSKMEVLNEVPVIKAEDKTLTVGDKFDAKDGVTATDTEDGSITDKIEVISNNVDTSKAGTYKVTYQVTDSQGASITKTITVTVKDKDTKKPTIDDNKKPNVSDTDKITSNTPKTSDTMNITLWISLIILSGGLLVVTAGIKFKKES